MELLLSSFYAYEKKKRKKENRPRLGNSLSAMPQNELEPWLGTQANFLFLVWILCCGIRSPERGSDLSRIFVQSF